MEKAFREEFDNLKKLKAKKEREINLLKDNIKKEEMEIKNKYSEQLDLLKSKVEDAKSINEDLTKAAYKLDRKITMIPNENILKIKKSSPDKLSIEKLKDNIESLKNNINDLECIKDSLSKKLNECDISIENYETLLEEKRQKKQEYKEEMENLIEDKLLATNKLESLKNKPLDEASRGNSAFAEVNDYADYLTQRKIYLNEKLKNSGIDIKKKTKELFDIKKEILAVKKQLEEECSNQMESQKTEIDYDLDRLQNAEIELSKSNSYKQNDLYKKLSDRIECLDKCYEVTKAIYHVYLKKFNNLEEKVKIIAGEIERFNKL